jgi:hypothetical protein
VINTPLGMMNVDVYSNNINIKDILDIKITIDELPNKFGTLFEVDKRFKIQVYVRIIKDLNEELHIECKFNPINNVIDSGIRNGIDTGIESGENLDLKSWHYKSLKLSIEAEDGCSLYNRAVHSKDMPKRLEEYFDEKYCDGYILVNTPKYLDYGIRVSLPNLESGEYAIIMFGTAWINMTSPDIQDIYTWFVADVTMM